MTQLAVIDGVMAILAADLVVEQLQSRADWQTRFTPQRTYLPTYDLKQIFGQTIVNVVATGIAYRQVNRAALEHEVTVEIGILEKPDPENKPGEPARSIDEKLDEAGDRHVALVEEIAEFFQTDAGRRGEVSGLPVAILRPSIPTLILREHIEGLQQLTSVVRLFVQITK